MAHDPKEEKRDANQPTYEDQPISILKDKDNNGKDDK